MAHISQKHITNPSALLPRIARLARLSLTSLINNIRGLSEVGEPLTHSKLKTAIAITKAQEQFGDGEHHTP